MIRIKRSTCPSILKKAKWSETKYNKKEVVKALWNMQKEKCCYCEQTIPYKGHSSAVDHFEPKSIFKGRRNDWKNLLLACPQCNGRKSNKFPIELTNQSKEVKVIYLKKNSNSKLINNSKKILLIDPSNPQSNPEDHIDFITDENNYSIDFIGLPKKKSKEGDETIKVIGLDDYYHQKKRRNYMLNTLKHKYHKLLSAIHYKNKDILKDCQDNFRMYMSDNGEYAGFVRSFARQRNMDKFYGLKIP